DCAIAIVSGLSTPGELPICWVYLPLPVARFCPFPILPLRALSPPVLTPFLFRALGGSVASLDTPLPVAIVHLPVAWRATFGAHHPFYHLSGPLALLVPVTHEGNRNSSVLDSVFSESRTGRLNRPDRICKFCV